MSVGAEFKDDLANRLHHQTIAPMLKVLSVCGYLILLFYAGAFQNLCMAVGSPRQQTKIFIDQNNENALQVHLPTSGKLGQILVPLIICVLLFRRSLRKQVDKLAAKGVATSAVNLLWWGYLAAGWRWLIFGLLIALSEFLRGAGGIRANIGACPSSVVLLASLTIAPLAGLDIPFRRLKPRPDQIPTIAPTVEQPTEPLAGSVHGKPYLRARPALIMALAIVTLCLLLWWKGFAPGGENPVPGDTPLAAGYRVKANAGDPEAALALGTLYLEGEGLAQNLALGFQWISKAALLGDSKAQTRLGFCCAQGIGRPKSDEEAIEWYHKAADQGDPLAETILGNCYAAGRGTMKDESAALEWWMKAANQGFARAATKVGLSYYLGKAVPLDYTEAERWFRKAADSDDMVGQLCLGNCYGTGNGVPKDQEQAAKWIQKAADHGSPKAQLQLGVIYSQGWGVPKDEARSLIFFRAAADQGLPEAQYLLGCCLYEGIGTVKDYVEAYRWTNLASVDSKDAKELLTHLESSMTVDQVAQGQRLSREWHQTEALRITSELVGHPWQNFMKEYAN